MAKAVGVVANVIPSQIKREFDIVMAVSVSNKGQKHNCVWDIDHACGCLWPRLGCFLKPDCFDCDYVDCLLSYNEAISGKRSEDRKQYWDAAIASGELF